MIVQGARLRDESRGAHYKPDFPDRNDEKFLKTTKAAFVDGAPEITYEEVDTQYIKPRPRVYTSSFELRGRSNCIMDSTTHDRRMRN